MKRPNFNEEKKLWKKGYKCVVGLDEAGRGPLAGPVVAAAVAFSCHCERARRRAWQSRGLCTCSGLLRRFAPRNDSFRINDSKKLAEKQREYFYKVLTNHPDIKWGIGRVSEKVIDKINILQASKLAMTRALASLVKSNCCQISSDRLKSDNSCFLLIDGNFTLPAEALAEAGVNPFSQKSIIKGDQKVFSIAAASIIAKVTRDRIMQKYHTKYPQYGFDQHKGYPTKAHLACLQKHGLCRLHRATFRPVSNLKLKIIN